MIINYFIVMEDSRDIAKSHHDTAVEHLVAAKARLSKQEEEERQRCHQLFRLTTGSRDTTYEWYKDRVAERVDGTCIWFLEHEQFQNWQTQPSGPLLVTADPGCGKSVLAKHLINKVLPPSATICYFFFKDQDQNTVRQALCALLHQLFSQKQSLIEHAVPRYREDGQGLVDSTASLWKVLRAVTNDPRAGPTIVVLDALDECAESEFADLIQNIQSQVCQAECGKLKYLLTSRPYEQILSKFSGLLKAFPNIHIPGEEQSEAISREVHRVITHRVNQLSEQKGLSYKMKTYLEKRLQAITNRTYLWVYLLFDYLDKESFKKTLKGVKSIITTLPKSVNEAYEQILNKSKDGERRMVRKALSIILAASRPLNVSEMNIALNIEDTTQSLHNLDLENEKDFKSRLKSLCGLFISIYHGKLYFLHQTAREFLLADFALRTGIPSAIQWQHSITTRQAHAVLAKPCLLYLNLFNSDTNRGIDVYGGVRNAFLEYSAKYWGSHFREANFGDDAIIVSYALRICDPDSRSYSAWFTIYWETTHIYHTDLTKLMVASYFGHSAVVRRLLKQGADIEAMDKLLCQTPLSWACRNGHVAVVRQLLEHGANVEAKDTECRTPLLWACQNGHAAVVRQLLEYGADFEAREVLLVGTPLLWACENGHAAVVRRLLKYSTDIEAKERTGRTPLITAAAHGYAVVVVYLLEKGAAIDARDMEGRTSLWWAAKNRHTAIVKQLLERGVDIRGQGHGIKPDASISGGRVRAHTYS